MSLVPHKIVALEGDTATAISTGKTTIASAVVVLYDSDNNAITLYDDAAFANGASSKVTGSTGELIVWITAGQYTQSVNGSTALPVTVGSASPITVDTFANMLLLRPEQTDQAFICQERANAKYILKVSGYVALAGDATFANGRVAQLQDISKVEFFGLLTDTTNDVAVFNSAFLRNTALGGRVNYNSKAYISTDLSIPIGVKLVGAHEYLDMTQRNRWDDLTSRIRLEPAATVNIANGAGIKNMLFYRADMTFPDDGLTATEVALYDGTAVTVNSAAPYVGYNTFLGFEYMLKTAATNTPRGRVEWNNFDCTNGIQVDLDLGAWSIIYNFGQPILTNSDADNIRTGIGFDIKNKSDWTTLVGNFTFQDTGYRITNSNQVKMLACGADHPTDGTDLYHTGIGFEIVGDSLDNFIVGCQSASHATGYRFNTDDEHPNYISDSHMWNMSSSGFGIEVLGGDVAISGGSVRGFVSDGGKGVFVNDANARVSLCGGMVMDGVAVGIDTPSFGEFTVSQDLIFRDVATIRSNEAVKAIASTVNISPLKNQSLQSISGTTTIGTFIGAGVMPEKIITFIITNGLTINHGNTILSGGSNFVAGAGSSITLQYITGNTWREIGRNAQ